MTKNFSETKLYAFQNTQPTLYQHVKQFLILKILHVSVEQRYGRFICTTVQDKLEQYISAHMKVQQNGSLPAHATTLLVINCGRLSMNEVEFIKDSKPGADREFVREFGPGLVFLGPA